ncbi:MAG: DNA-binding protein WhiA, partial [Chloroflexota bacterium]|nr:DNA-binding protein WhiA [Chloroflexota bacterium]
GRAATGRARSAAVARLAVRLEERAGRQEGGGTAGPTDLDWDSAEEHCRMAWLRGRFLVDGSLTFSPGQTHLELVVPSEEGEVLAARLAALEMPASWRLRRGRAVITWKGREVVISFLRRIGATAAVLDLESRGVVQSLHGQLNRVLNAESANLRRLVAASSRQLAAIEHLQASGQWDGLPALDRRIARLRCQAPEQSLRELAERLGLSRARVQRSFQRLEAQAERIRATSGMG